MPEQIPHPESNLRVEAKKAGALVVEPPITVAVTARETKPKTVDLERLKREEPIIFHELFTTNNYNIRSDELKNKVVFDCGANVGYFSLLAVHNGAKKVYAVEAQKVVFYEGLMRNISEFDNIRPIFAAVWSEDGRTLKLVNQHVGSTITTDGDPVTTMTLATIAALATEPCNNDWVLKLDVEGSEFDVILTASKELMNKFATVYIELHGNSNKNPAYHNVDLVRNRLTEFGFKRTYMIQQFGGSELDPVTKQPILTIPMDVFVEKWIK
tara:strand:- start:131 stop:937 length:807 start_codon:yes stop_codon:yes gene_type:complete